MSHPHHSTALASLAVAAGFVLGATFGLDAQQPRQSDPQTAQQIVGTVVDEATGAPLGGAFVVLEDGRRVQTGADGTFRFGSLEPGRYRIAALARGCSQVGGVVQLRPGQRRTLQFQMQIPRPGAGDDDPVRRGGSVDVITQDRLREFSDHSLLEVLRREVPGLKGGSIAGAAPMTRGRNSILGSSGMLLILDGIRMTDGVGTVLESTRAEDVLRVEVVKGAAAGWTYGAGAGNGVIVVKTRSGPGSLDPLRSAETCSVDWSAF